MLLRSAGGDGVKWYINTTGATVVDVQRADVKDSVSTLLIKAYRSQDSGNNLNWSFVVSGTSLRMY